MNDDKDLRDMVHQMEAQLLATQAAIRSILAATPELRRSVAQELEQQAVRPEHPGVLVGEVHRDDEAAGGERPLLGARRGEGREDDREGEERAHHCSLPS